MGDQPVAATGKKIQGLFQKGSPAQSMEARAPHDFEHDALVPGPGNAEHFSLAFTTWRKVKGGKPFYIQDFSPFALLICRSTES